MLTFSRKKSHLGSNFVVYTLGDGTEVKRCVETQVKCNDEVPEIPAKYLRAKKVCDEDKMCFPTYKCSLDTKCVKDGKCDCKMDDWKKEGQSSLCS